MERRKEMPKYVLSYYRLENQTWQYHADIVEADSPKDIKLPNATLYSVQVEQYDDSIRRSRENNQQLVHPYRPNR